MIKFSGIKFRIRFRIVIFCGIFYFVAGEKGGAKEADGMSISPQLIPSSERGNGDKIAVILRAVTL